MLCLLSQDESIGLISCPTASSAPESSVSYPEYMVSLLRCVTMTGRYSILQQVSCLVNWSRFSVSHIRQELFSLIWAMTIFPEGDREEKN